MKSQEIHKLCLAIWQMQKQAPHDLGGEQREFYLPRLTEAMLACAQLFPAQFASIVAAEEKIS